MNRLTPRRSEPMRIKRHENTPRYFVQKRVVNLLSFCMLAILLGLSVMPVAAQADSDSSDAKQAVLQRMRNRFPQVLQAQREGLVGENYRGYLEIPSDAGNVPADTRKLVQAQNNDRKQLYTILAKELNTTPEKVASRNRIRLYERAEQGFWLQRPDGAWYRKS